MKLTLKQFLATDTTQYLRERKLRMPKEHSYVENEEEVDVDTTEECPVCYGSGTEYDETCVRCGGRGRLTKDGDYVEDEEGEDDLPDEQDDSTESKWSVRSLTDEEQDGASDEEVPEEDPNRQGMIRTIKNAHLVFKRPEEDGTFEELWVYKTGDTNRNELELRHEILAGTDIPSNSTKSKDGTQHYELWTAGNIQFVHITGLIN